MATLANMVLDDPASFNILTDDLKSKIIAAATVQVNIQAALTRKKTVAEINDNFNNRNNFTVRQTQFTKAENVKTLDAIHVEIGATDRVPYMKRQEEGGPHEPLKGDHIGIPTDAARGGSVATPVQKKYRLNQVNNHRQRRWLEGKALRRGRLAVRGFRPAARRLPDTLRTFVSCPHPSRPS
jgi:hypothetical protein